MKMKKILTKRRLCELAGLKEARVRGPTGTQEMEKIDPWPATPAEEKAAEEEYERNIEKMQQRNIATRLVRKGEKPERIEMSSDELADVTNEENLVYTVVTPAVGGEKFLHPSPRRGEAMGYVHTNPITGKSMELPNSTPFLIHKGTLLDPWPKEWNKEQLTPFKEDPYGRPLQYWRDRWDADPEAAKQEIRNAVAKWGSKVQAVRQQTLAGEPGSTPTWPWANPAASVRLPDWQPGRAGGKGYFSLPGAKTGDIEKMTKAARKLIRGEEI